MRPTLVLLLLLSTAAGPCTNQNLGTVAVSPDATMADASMSGAEPDASPPGTAPTMCTVDSECTLTPYAKPVASTADCYCNSGCGNYVNLARAQEFEAQWHRFCDQWPGRSQCIPPPCVPPLPAGCEAQQCRGLDPSLTTGAIACDPLSPRPLPVVLETVIGVGRHADGTLYVLEKPNAGDYRVFVSGNGVLQRLRTSGSGMTTNAGGSVSYVVSAEDDITLKVQIESGVKRMGVIRGPFSGKDFTIGQDGDVLQPVGTDALAGLPLRNLPGQIVFEVNAELQDGRHLLVTRPRDDWGYSDFRLFLGPRTAMAERRITGVVRGTTTTITFILDFQEATAHYPSSLGPPDSPSWVKISGLMEPLTDSATSPAGLSFLCRSPAPDVCRGPGRYEAGKEGSYRPCCSGLTEVFQTYPAYGQGGMKVCTMPPLRVYACVRGSCGDGVCEEGEAPSCGCAADCPSAVWGPEQGRGPADGGTD